MDTKTKAPKTTQIIKPGKVVILLNGRYAGAKAAVVKAFDEGSKPGREYGYAIVAGVRKAPLKVTKKMSASKIQKRSKVKPFLKLVNYSHVMPTRYTVDAPMQFKDAIGLEDVKDPAKRTIARKEIAKVFTEKHMEGKNAWFFSKLRF